jgi:hypothetical protein
MLRLWIFLQKNKPKNLSETTREKIVFVFKFAFYANKLKFQKRETPIYCNLFPKDVYLTI